MFGLDESRRIWIIVKRVPQLTNGDFKNRIGHKSLWPNSLQQLFFCDELTGTVKKIVEHRKDFRPQFYRLRASPETLVTHVQTKRIEVDEITVAHCTSPNVTESLPQTYDLVCSAGLFSEPRWKDRTTGLLSLFSFDPKPTSRRVDSRVRLSTSPRTRRRDSPLWRSCSVSSSGC